MNESGRAEAWYSRWVMHVCLIAALLVAAAAVGVGARLDEPSQLPPDRAIPAAPVRLSGTTLEHVRVAPAGGSGSGQTQIAGK